MILLESPRLYIRNTHLEDISILHEIIFNDEEVVKHTFGNEQFTLEETKKFIKQSCNFNKTLGLSTLIEKETEKIIGLAGVIQCDYLEQPDYEFGFILSRDTWGKGYATEIGKAQIDYIQDIIKAPRAIALAHCDNITSKKCIKKLGLKYFSTISTPNRGNRFVYLKEF